MELSSGGWNSRPGNSLAEVPMSGDESCPAKRELSGPVIIPLKKGSRKRVVRAIMRSKETTKKNWYAPKEALRGRTPVAQRSYEQK